MVEVVVPEADLTHRGGLATLMQARVVEPVGEHQGLAGGGRGLEQGRQHGGVGLPAGREQQGGLAALEGGQLLLDALMQAGRAGH